MTQRIVQSPCGDTRLDKFTKALIANAFESINAKGEFRLALSEADSLDMFYTQLMCDPSMRAMPWSKTRVWFFGDVPGDNSAQLAITTHSGIEEEQVFRLDETTVEEIDCCVCTSDKKEMPVELIGKCRSWLMLETQTQSLDSDELGGVVHLYAIEPATESGTGSGPETNDV